MKITVVALCLLCLYSLCADSLYVGGSLNLKLMDALKALDSQVDQLDAASAQLINALLMKVQQLRSRGLLNLQLNLGLKSLSDDYWNDWSP